MTPMSTTNEHARIMASQISRVLRRGGMNPLGSGTPYTREGLRVKQSMTQVRVAADLDSATEAQRVAEAAAAILREAGFILTDERDAAFYVVGTNTR